MSDPIRRRYVVIGLVYLAALVTVLFFPFVATDAERVWIYGERWFGIGYLPWRETALDVVVNVLLFVPVGLVLHGWWRGSSPSSLGFATRALLTAALLSASVETLQWLTGWREGSVRDVISNTAGAAIGIVLERLRRVPAPLTPPGGRR
jgi:glycopeptide antibiotics resistance protein